MFSTFGLLYVQIPLWTTVLYIIYRLYWELSTEAYDRHRAKERGCEPPKVRRSSFWGLSLIITNAKFLKNHTILENGHKEFERYNGRTLLIRFLGKRILSTNEPDNVQSILATDFNSWSIGVNRKPFIPLLGEGIFASDGAAWRHSRDLLRPNFNRAQVADVDLFERHIGHLFRVIPHDGSTVDLQPLFFRLSMDISTEFLFGQSTNDLAAARSSPETARFVESWNRCTTNLVGGGRIGYLSAFFTDPQFTRDCKVVHGKMLSFLIPVTQDFADSIIARALSSRSTSKPDSSASSSNRYIFLDHLFSQTSDHTKIRTELLNVLLAGRETTASLLSNLLFTLSRRPDIQSALRHEIQTLSSLDLEAVKSLKYLRAFINESLRMYPILPLNGRQAIEDTVLPVGGGPRGDKPVFVAKGTLVGWNLYSMQRQKDVWGEDAEEFRVERWLDEVDEKGEVVRKGVRPGWAFLPFNGGPRICIGQQFALAETSYILIRLLQEYERIESRDPEPWREKMQITCVGFGRCKVAMTPRS
ncbi:MAG: hypothetical protein LQ340_004111 [Diploschistes diacapsis]|nr:MAG: hypothetical protein LQ340_004111 [Diploschistes diacapsis]